jgi:glycyl-tRNA synthetase beta chain
VDDIYDVYLRINAIQKLFTENQSFFEEIIIGYNRANNITRNYNGLPPVNAELFQEDIEKQLYDVLLKVEKDFYPATKRGDYLQASKFFSLLLPTLHTFFDKVLVMTDSEPVRNNRLSLLKKVVGLWSHVADLSQIVIQEESK